MNMTTAFNPLSSGSGGGSIPGDGGGSGGAGAGVGPGATTATRLGNVVARLSRIRRVNGGGVGGSVLAEFGTGPGWAATASAQLMIFNVRDSIGMSGNSGNIFVTGGTMVGGPGGSYTLPEHADSSQDAMIGAYIGGDPAATRVEVAEGAVH